MGLIAWNYKIPDQAIAAKSLARAGVVLLVKDVATADAPGLDEAIRSGLVDSTPSDTGGPTID